MGETSGAAPQPAADMTESGTGEPVGPGAAAAESPAPAAIGPRPAIAPMVTTAQPRQNAWVMVIIVLAAAVVCSVVVAWGTAFSHVHRLSAAGAALLDVVAFAMLAHLILLWYQSGSPSVPTAGPGAETLNDRRRGLKAAVMGQDGRVSTSKTQVVLWTGAVVWALIDLLLLARASPGNLFSSALTSNWRPEYLFLLGLPVAAAATAKAVVSGSNGGKGPVPHSDPTAQPGPQATRVYVRDPVPPEVKGFVTGVAELITSDDRSVSWADLQYVVFTLITLIYFLVQVLAQPQRGLPAVPAALLTLMGVSAGGYTALKILETRGTVPTQG